MLSILNRALEGKYHLEREVGAGGMATVYIAKDLKHRRQVAIKVLRQDISASVGAERFLREIEIVAQLQHPHILPLLDSGEVEGFIYYVMPFVEGPTLAERLRREGELPIQEAIRILIGIVDALAHAHDHGVIHRDVKPDNVMLSGRHALVADFGVARAVTSASEGSDLTTVGVALGTPRYMAPEQASAAAYIDHRADLYAVGIVAYEMLTGETPFRGTTPQQLLAAQVTETATPVSKYRPSVSLELERIVMRCLEKRPANRWQSAQELLTQLESLGTPSGGTAPTAARLPADLGTRRTLWYLAAATVTVVAVAAAGLQSGWFTAGSSSVPVLGQSTRVISGEGLQTDPALSPDGTLIAFAAGTATQMRIYIQPVAGGRTITLSEDSAAFEIQPRWSPDGTRILYLNREGAQVASSLGGVSRRIAGPGEGGAPFSSSGGGVLPVVNAAAWSPDGKRAFIARGGAVSVVPIAGGPEVELGTLPYELHSCDWSSAGDWVACTSGNLEGRTPGNAYGNIAPSTIVLVDPATGAVREVTDRTAGNHSPVWSPDGTRLFYLSNAQGQSDVYVVDVDRDGQPGGSPQRVTTGLGANTMTIAANGRRIAYVEYTARSNIWSIPIPASAVDASAARQLTTGSQVIESVTPSVDGRWLLYDSNLHGNSDIFRIPIDGGSPERLTTDPADEFAPNLSPDGTRLTYHTWKTGTRDVAVKPLDGGELLVTHTDAQESYPVFSPDGRVIAFHDQRVQNGVRSGLHVVYSDESGEWGDPVHLRSGTGGVDWMPDQSLVYVTGDGIEVIDPESGVSRVLYAARPGSDDPVPERACSSEDGLLVYFKSHDAAGRARFWSVPASGGAPTLLVRFDDLDRPSIRNDFGVGAGRFFFTIEERRSDIWLAEIGER